MEGALKDPSLFLKYRYFVLTLFLAIQALVILEMARGILPFLVFFVLPFLAAFVVLSLYKPFMGLLLASFIFLGVDAYLLMEVRIPTGIFNLYFMDFVFLFLVTSLFLRWVLGEKHRLPDAKLYLPVLLFLGSSLLSCFVAFLRGISPRDILFDFRNSFYLVSFFFLTIVIITNMNLLRVLVLSIVPFGIIGSIWGIYRSYVGPPLVREFKSYQFGRLTSPNEIVFAILLLFSLISLFFSTKKGEKIFWLLLGFISGLAMILSLARGSWLAFMAGFVFASWIVFNEKGMRRILFNFLIVISLTFGLFVVLYLFNLLSFVPVLQRMASSFNFQSDLAILARFFEWRKAEEIFRSYPIFGTGYGYYFHVLRPLIGYVDRIYIHNAYLYILAKAGLVGLIFFLYMLFSFLKKGLKSIKSLKDPFLKGTLISSLSTIIILLIKSLTTYTFQTFTFTPIIGIVFGIISVIVGFSEEKGSYGRNLESHQE